MIIPPARTAAMDTPAATPVAGLDVLSPEEEAAAEEVEVEVEPLEEPLSVEEGSALTVLSEEGSGLETSSRRT